MPCVGEAHRPSLTTWWVSSAPITPSPTPCSTSQTGYGGGCCEHTQPPPGNPSRLRLGQEWRLSGGLRRDPISFSLKGGHEAKLSAPLFPQACTPPPRGLLPRPPSPGACPPGRGLRSPYLGVPPPRKGTPLPYSPSRAIPSFSAGRRWPRPPPSRRRAGWRWRTSSR